uniref:FTO alpha-ketoglutarate dependent dioxygenase n=1 Tax=Chelonoidis abingdonii TaxID=106734 RepID=A0A8C0J9K2_CHEAB
KKKHEKEKEGKLFFSQLLEELGESWLPYLTPRDAEFHQLWKTAYSKLLLRKADKIPQELHHIVQEIEKLL